MTTATEMGLLVAIFMALGLAIMALVSVILFGEYLQDGSVSMGPWDAPCLVMPIIVVMLAFLCTRPAIVLIRSLESDRARRASYFLILFPPVLVGFVLATTNTDWAPSLTFGFPLFAVGAVGFPYAALVLHREAKAHFVRTFMQIRCVRCTYVFDIHRDSDVVPCPHCGQPNLNPMRAPATNVGPATPPKAGGEGGSPGTGQG